MLLHVGRVQEFENVCMLHVGRVREFENVCMLHVRRVRKFEPCLDLTVSNATLLRIKQHFPSSNADCPTPNNPISPPMPHALHQSIVSRLKPLLPHTNHRSPSPRVERHAPNNSPTIPQRCMLCIRQLIFIS